MVQVSHTKKRCAGPTSSLKDQPRWLLERAATHGLRLHVSNHLTISWTFGAILQANAVRKAHTTLDHGPTFWKNARASNTGLGSCEERASASSMVRCNGRLAQMAWLKSTDRRDQSVTSYKDRY